MSEINQAFSFLFDNIWIDLQQLKQQLWPAYVRCPVVVLPCKANQLDFLIEDKLTTLTKGELFGAPQLIDNELIQQLLDLKRFFRDVPADFKQQLNQTQNSCNPYNKGLYLGETRGSTRFYELIQSCDLFKTMREIVLEYLDYMDTNMGDQPNRRFTIVGYSAQFNFQSLIQEFFNQDAELKLRIEEISKKKIINLPIRVFNYLTNQNIDQKQQFFVNLAGAKFECFQRFSFDLIQQAEQTQQVYTELSSLGCNLMIIDLIRNSPDEFRDLDHFANLYQVVQLIQLVLSDSVIFQGGHAVVHIKQMNGRLMAQLLQLIGIFFEKASIQQPMFSNFLSQDCWLVLLGKRQSKQFNSLGQNVIQKVNTFLQKMIQQLQVYEFPIDKQEEFKFMYQIYKATDPNIEKYLKIYYTDLYKTQVGLLLAQALYLGNFKFQIQITTEVNYLIYQLFNNYRINGSEQLLSQISFDEFQTLVQQNFESIVLGDLFPENRKRTKLQEAYAQKIFNQVVSDMNFILATQQRKQFVWQEKAVIKQKIQVFKASEDLLTDRERLERIRKEEERKKLELQKKLEQQKKEEEIKKEQINSILQQAERAMNSQEQFQTQVKTKVEPDQTNIKKEIPKREKHEHKVKSERKLSQNTQPTNSIPPKTLQGAFPSKTLPNKQLPMKAQLPVKSLPGKLPTKDISHNGVAQTKKTPEHPRDLSDVAKTHF